MSRFYRYDLEGIDLDDCSKVVLVPLNVDLVPSVMGTLEALAWRARHNTDDSHAIGVEAYARLQEVFTVNECITDVLGEIRDALAYLQCICDGGTTQQQTDQTIISETVFNSLLNDENVSYTYQEDINYEIGSPPGELDTERCRRSQAVFFNLLDSARRVINLQLAVGGAAAGPLAGIIAAFLTVPVPVSIIIGLVVGITYVLIDDAVKADVELWETMSPEAICTIYTARDMVEASEELSAMIDATLNTVAGKTYLKLFYKSLAMGEMYQNSNNWESFNNAECEDCVQDDPDCIVLDCDTGHWNTDGHPEYLACDGGFPYCAGGYMRWEHSGIVCPQEDFTLRVRWRAISPGAPARIGINLDFLDNFERITVGVTAPLSNGETRTDTYHLYNPGAADREITIFLSQAVYYGAVEYFCIEPGIV